MAINVSKLAANVSATVFLMLAGSCLVDSDHRCGAHQRLQDEQCVCDAGYGLTGNACVECAANEVGSLDGCACASGFGRTDPSKPCVSTASLGQACDADPDCADPADSFCASDSPRGYCTHADCTSSAECSNDYSCNTRNVPSFCERPPTGAGSPCQSDTDCSGFEAAYCEVVLAHACLKSGCKPDPNVCPGDWVCCDIPLIGESLCLPPGRLTGGECPGGGSLVGSN